MTMHIFDAYMLSQKYATWGPQIWVFPKIIGVSKNNGTSISSILIGFSIIFVIHFGVYRLFLEKLLGNLRFLGSFSFYDSFFQWINARIRYPGRQASTAIKTEGLCKAYA